MGEVGGAGARSKKLLTGCGAGLTVIVALLVAAALQVDDWDRDLTTNEAATSVSAEDPELRPITTRRTARELARVVEEVAGRLPRWEVVEQRSERGELVIHLERTSAVFRFVDDVVVRIHDRGWNRIVHAESRSRVGKGDLGQNPRNLKALLGGVREALGSDAR